MTRKRCLWATSQPWRAPFRVSAHHYAKFLVEQGWDVAFLSHPISPLHLLHARADTGDRFANWRAGGAEDLDGHLYHYTPLTLLPPHHAPVLRHERVLDLWPRMTMPSLRRRLAARGFASVDLLVLDSERYGFLLDTIPAKTTVLRVVDTLQGFDATAPAWVDRFRALVPRVQHVVVTSSVIAGEMQGDARSVIHVPNGVDVAHFAAPDVPAPPEYDDIPTPCAVYVGALEGWFDAELVGELARRRPDVSFVLIGPAGAEVRALRERPNVYVLGVRAYEELPAYLRHAQVGLIPFRDNALTRTVNPIKLYEYLAAGLPVVATTSAEMETLHSPATLCRSTDQFERAIAAATATRPDPEPLRAFARDADWRQRGRVLLNAIGCEEESLAAGRVLR